jgi:hypothetical protein
VFAPHLLFKTICFPLVGSVRRQEVDVIGATGGGSTPVAPHRGLVVVQQGKHELERCGTR